MRNLFVLLTWLVLGMTACGPASPPAPTLDVALISTQAAQTVAVSLTQTAVFLTASAPTATPEPSPTPLPTWTPIATLSPFILPSDVLTPGGVSPLMPTATLALLPPVATPSGPLCNDLAWVTDIGLPDGSVLKPGQAFEKGWLVKNTGVCSWEIGYRLVRVGGNTNFGGDTFVIRTSSEVVKPGAVVEISLDLVAPKQPGLYEAIYQMYTNLDVPFGSGLSISIEVRK